MNRGKDSLGCGFVLNALVAISIFVGIIFILGAGLKGCKCSSSSSSPGSTYHERQVNRLHEQRIQKDRENGWCEECHGKGTILFSPNSWEGPGFCEECNKEVKGSHPHVCKACNGTGKAK